MTSSSVNPAEKFDRSRADEYARQSRIALAGYDACHDLAACMLAASLGEGRAAHILAVGAGGTAQEIIAMASLEPGWRFTAVDPSAPMLETARQQLQAQGLLERTEVRLATVDELAADEPFDGATLIGVLHHLPGDEAKRQLLRAIARRLKPGAPLIVAGNHYAYASQPLLLAAWGNAGASRARRRMRYTPSWGKSFRAPTRPIPRRRCNGCSKRAVSAREHVSSAACSGAPG